MRAIARCLAAAALMLSGGVLARDPALIPSLERLAAANNAEAIYHLGMAYHIGSGVAEDHARALDLFRRAAALGDPLASYKVGCYLDGQGDGLVPPDAKLALQYKLVAARAGYALAEQDVAALYARSGDATEALTWLQKSAAQGWSGGLMALARAYNGAPGIRPDPARTAAYFRLFLVRSEPDPNQVKWLDRFEEKLSSEDRRRAGDIVRSFRAVPTPLTISALSGQRAAEALVAAATRG